jgi:hypothetical protein
VGATLRQANSESENKQCARMIIFRLQVRLGRSQVHRSSNKIPVMPMDAINVAQDLENWFQISCVRRIQVNLNAKGKKVPIGEDNSLTPEQIANDCGNPNSNTLSIYIKHLPGIAVIDFDTKELDGCALWELCCQ